MENFANHKRDCQFKHCKKCYKYFYNLADHTRNCKGRTCSKCHKFIPPSETHRCLVKAAKKHCKKCGTDTSPTYLARHSKICQGKKKRCATCSNPILPNTIHKCGRKFCNICGRYPTKDRFHLHECSGKRCSKCRKRLNPLNGKHQCKHCKKCTTYVPRDEFDQHFLACNGNIACRKCRKPQDEKHDCGYKSCYRCNIWGPGHLHGTHLKICRFKRCWQCRTSKIPVELYDSHLNECKFRICTNCLGPVPADTLDAHKAECQKRHCLKCKKPQDLAEFDTHMANCTYRACSQCNQRFPTEAKLAAHLAKCTYRYCHKCKFYRPLPTEAEFQAHVATCSYRRFCHGCRKWIFEKQVDTHKATCTSRYCHHCGLIYNLDQDGQTVHACAWVRCSTCRQRIKKSAYPSHRPDCTNLLFEKKRALHEIGCCSWLKTLSSQLCPHPQVPGQRLCKNHAKEYAFKGNSRQSEYNTEVEQLRFRRILLDTRLQSLLRKFSTMSIITKRWKERPKTVAVCDIEGTSMRLQPTSESHLNVFQVAVRNADGDWIIEPTIIHHHVSKHDLHDHNKDALRYGRNFTKFYGEIDDTEAKGIGSRTATWSSIGQELETYTTKFGKLDTWLEWSSTGCDWLGFYAGLASVGYDHLLPPQPNFTHSPLQWWRKIRKIFPIDLKGLRLSLGNLFEILFPEDTHLLSQVHYAGADVRMLSKILQYTLTDGSVIKSKIGSHFSPVTHSLINFPSINLDEIELSDEDLEECEDDDSWEQGEVDDETKRPSDNTTRVHFAEVNEYKHARDEGQKEAGPPRKHIRRKY